MKPYSITEGDFSHASTSIAQHGDFDNGQSLGNGTGYSRSRTASHQTARRPAGLLSLVWARAAPTGRYHASGDCDGLRTDSRAAPTLSLSRMLAPLVSSHSSFRRALRRNGESFFTRSSHPGRKLLALPGSFSAVAEVEWSVYQCGGDPSAHQSAGQATGDRATRGSPSRRRTFDLSDGLSGKC